MENKAQSPKRKERERRGDYLCACLCYNVWRSHCLSDCVCMCMYLIQGFCQERVVVLLPFPLWIRAVQEGWLAGWLAAKERKQSLSNSRWRTACAYTAETYTHSHACTHAALHTQAAMFKYSSFYYECDPDRTLQMSAMENQKFSFTEF